MRKHTFSPQCTDYNDRQGLFGLDGGGGDLEEVDKSCIRVE